MSIYQQYDRVIYWNKSTNVQLFNNVLDSYTSLFNSFQKARQKRNKLKETHKIKVDANDIFFNIVAKLSEKYPGFVNKPEVTEKHCKMIESQISKETDLTELQERIYKKIQKMVEEKLATTNKRVHEFFYNPSFFIKQGELKEKELHYLQLWICMLNIFSNKSQFVYRLITNQKAAGQQIKKMQTKDVIVSYYYTASPVDHIKIGVAIKISDDIEQYYMYRAENIECCRQGNEKWLAMESDKHAKDHSIHKLLFVLFSISMGGMSMTGDLEDKLKESEKENWEAFIQKLPAVIGYLDMDSYYDAFTYLHQRE